jgi:menaquinone-dependent protoporphyrinogen oxidase
MKTLIIYASKYGSAEKCSNLLRDKLNDEVEIVNIKKESIPEITLFDNIIVGGSIYMGRIQKEVKQFCLKNISVLKNKNLGFFICCMNENEGAEKQINTSFPEELLKNAVARGYFGGEFKFKKMNFLEGFIIKKISKTSEDSSKLLQENINEFAQLMNNI